MAPKSDLSTVELQPLFPYPATKCLCHLLVVRLVNETDAFLRFIEK